MTPAMRDMILTGRLPPKLAAMQARYAAAAAFFKPYQEAAKLAAKWEGTAKLSAEMATTSWQKQEEAAREKARREVVEVAADYRRNFPKLIERRLPYLADGSPRQIGFVRFD